MPDDFLCNRREQGRQDLLKPVHKPEVLEAFDMDEEEEHFFYLAILEQEQEHRKQLGILGWWPIYETHQRIQEDPDFARRFETVLEVVFAAAAIAFAAFVLPHLPWIGPRINRFFTACWAILGW
jgi:hypothetical protein